MISDIIVKHSIWELINSGDRLFYQVDEIIERLNRCYKNAEMLYATPLRLTIICQIGQNQFTVNGFKNFNIF